MMPVKNTTTMGAADLYSVEAVTFTSACIPSTRSALPPLDKLPVPCPSHGNSGMDGAGLNLPHFLKAAE